MNPRALFALAVVAFLAALGWRWLGSASTAPAAETRAPADAEGEAAPKAPPVVGDREATAERPAPPPAPPRPAFGKTREDFLAVYKASDRAKDFTDVVPAGHEPAAMRAVNDAFADWSRDPANKDAAVRYLGIDCQRPPCLLVLEYVADQDPAFIGRSEGWLRGKGLGTLETFTHRLDETDNRMWYFFNPYPEGTREAHQYAAGALERIRAEAGLLSDYNPSRDGPAGEGRIGVPGSAETP